MNIFNAYGQIDRNAISAEALAELSEEATGALSSVIIAADACDAAEARVVEARKTVNELAEAHRAARETLDRVRGKVDPVAAARAVLNRSNGVKPPTLEELQARHKKLQAEGRKSFAALNAMKEEDQAAADPNPDAIKAATDAHNSLVAQVHDLANKIQYQLASEPAIAAEAEADQKLADARAEFFNLNVALKPARAALADALENWSRYAERKSTLDVARDFQRRSQDAARPVSEDVRTLPVNLQPHHARRTHRAPTPVRGSTVR